MISLCHNCLQPLSCVVKAGSHRSDGAAHDERDLGVRHVISISKLEHLAMDRSEAVERIQQRVSQWRIAAFGGDIDRRDRCVVNQFMFALLLPEMVQSAVARGAEQPGAKRGRPRQCGDATVYRQPDFLLHVLRRFADKAAQVSQRSIAVLIHEPRERHLIADLASQYEQVKADVRHAR